MERHLATVWESVVDAAPDSIALVQGATRRSFAEFDDRASRLATALTEAGLGPGSKVALYLYNSPEYLEAYYAALKISATPINVNYRYLDEELLYLLENSESEALVFHTELGERVGAVRERASRLKLLAAVEDGTGTAAGASLYDDIVASHEPAPRRVRSADEIGMTYTGGTTGMPKGVMSRVGGGVDNLLASVPPVLGLAPLGSPDEIAPLVRERLAKGEQWVSLPACPLMHGTGIAIGALPSTTFGGCVAFLDKRRLDPVEFWDLIDRERVNSVAIVGDAFARPLLRELDDGAGQGRDLSSLRLLLSAGAMFSFEVRSALLEHLPNAAIVDYIAATEGAMGAAISTRGAVAPTGRFTPGPHVKVLKENGEPVQPGSGEVGLVAAGGAVPEGYYKDSEKTAGTFRMIDGERYSTPGDFATVEADGSITLLGRGSQCINTGGEKVFAEEVEEVVKRHASVNDCLVFGVDDERFGQRVVGVFSAVPGSSPDPAEIISEARTQLARYKIPRELRAVAAVPRAPNGKADYRTARSLFEEGS